MKRWSLLLIIGLMLTACQAPATPTPEPTSTATDEPTASPVPTSAPTFTSAPPTPIPPTPIPLPTATPVPNDVWVNAVNGLNMRAEAAATAKLVTTLKDKQHLIALSAPAGPDAAGITWQNVRADDGQAGFVSTAFLTTTNPAGPTVSTPVAATLVAPTPVVAAPPLTSTVPANVTGDVYVTAANGLNLRSQANTTSNIVATVAFAQHLTMLGAPIGPDAAGITWQAVRTDDSKTGYVAAEFVSTAKPGVTPTITATAVITTPIVPTATPTATVSATPTTTSDVWVIAGGGLFLRTQPSTTGGVVAALNYGQHLTALSARTAPDAGGIAWQNVRTDANQTGYAAADFLSTTPPITTTPTITATATPTTTTQVQPQAETLNVSMAASPAASSAAVELFQRINALRAENGLNQLTWNDQLATAALRHNEDMAATGRVSHTGSDGTLEQQRIAATGYVASASDEVIYASVNGIEPVWGFWSTHAIHRYVLTNARFTEIGISAYTAGAITYFTADLGKP